ncbi:hypothetical protein OSTOST_23167 [Ostertagia ostertagi]
MICACDVEVSPAKCNCPDESITNIRADISHVFPISSPFMRLLKKGNSLAALSSREEMIIALESTYMRDSAEYIVQQNCSISLAPLTGCYNCQEGATLTAFCHTNIHSWIVVHCEQHTFSIECDVTNKTTLLALDFQQAVVRQECSVECDERLQKIPLQGTLAFLPHISDEQIFESHVSSWTPSSTWLQDWRIPDFTPIIDTIKNHWKTSLVLFGTAAVIAAAIYAMGPAILLAVIQVTPKILGFTLKITASALHITWLLVKHTTSCVKRALAVHRSRRND